MIAWLAANPISSALGITLAASLAFGGLQCSQKNEALTDAAEARTALAEYEASIAKEREVFERQARATEQRHAADMARIAAEYERERQNAEAAASRVVADLRNGNIRLRKQWAGCSRNLPESAEGSGEVDGTDGLRQDSAGRIIGAVTACQAQRDALIDVIEAQRR